jgi:arsenate reductase
MAEAFLRAYADNQFEVYSAGLEPKGYILPEVLTVMKELGFDMAGQTSKGVEEYLGKVVFAHTITLCGDAEENCPAIFLNMGNHEHWPFDDPAKVQGDKAERVEATRVVRDQIDQRVTEWVKQQDIHPVSL